MPLPEGDGEQLAKEQMPAHSSARRAGSLLLPLPMQDGAAALLPWGWGGEKVVEQGRVGAYAGVVGGKRGDLQLRAILNLPG